MQKIKNLITALIEAVFGSKKSYIAAQALPQNNSWTTLTPDSDSITAAYDGYLKLFIKTTSTGASWFNAGVVGGISVNLPPVNFSGAMSSISLPVKKGDVVQFLYNGCEFQTIQLFRLVGGGD